MQFSTFWPVGFAPLPVWQLDLPPKRHEGQKKEVTILHFAYISFAYILLTFFN
jgi:hypothetical protein